MNPANVREMVSGLGSEHRINRRREPRIAVDDPASMKMLSPLDPKLWDVRVLDVSRHGLKFRAPLSLAKGVILQIHMREMFVMGEVCYVTAFRPERDST